MKYFLFQVFNVFEYSGYTFTLHCKRDWSQEIISSKGKTISTYGLKHGDMIYLLPQNVGDKPSKPTENVKNGTATSTVSLPSTSLLSFGNATGSKIPTRSNVEEDQVDLQLSKMDGTVKRKRDPKKYINILLS